MIQENVTPAQIIAATLVGKAKTRQVSASRPIVLRLPLHLLSEIDTMAARAGNSRNIMCSELLGLAIDTVRKELPEEVLDEIDQVTLTNLSENLQAGDIEPLEG